jgi:hypothetical protein
MHLLVLLLDFQFVNANFLCSIINRVKYVGQTTKGTNMKFLWNQSETTVQKSLLIISKTVRLMENVCFIFLYKFV